MSDEDVIKHVEVKSGSSVVIEHKRGSGTRDQDKVKVKEHGHLTDTETLRNIAVENAIEAMETLRSSNKELGDGE